MASPILRAFALLALTPLCTAALGGTTILRTEKTSIAVAAFATELEHPWSLAFLPDRTLLVSERRGRLRRMSSDGAESQLIENLPPVLAIGQGGLLDVVVAPDYATSKTIFFSYAESRDAGNGTSVARAQLEGSRLHDLRIIFRQAPSVESQGHFGSRLVFARDGSLFVTLGERQLKHFTIRAQDLETHFGKIVRILPDGSAPPDNPFRHVPGAQPEVFSYGHRNVQGAALHPKTGELWITEHGPKGGDELNIVKAGANYGWPLVTYGTAYNGDRIGIGQERAGIEKPINYWVPSIGVSGLTFYTGDRFPEWKGNLFVGGLYGVLMRLELAGDRVVKEEPLLRELRERIRDVRQGPDGLLYVLTDSPRGRVLRLEPAAE
jgi:glucose/arabinose dehydrogenase